MTICGHLLLACFAGTKSASSVSFHFMRNINSPDVSVAPIIRSGMSPRSNPSLRSDFLLFVVFESTESLVLRFFESLVVTEIKKNNDSYRTKLNISKLFYLLSSFETLQMRQSVQGSLSFLLAPMYCRFQSIPSTSGNIPPNLFKTIYLVQEYKLNRKAKINPFWCFSVFQKCLLPFCSIFTYFSIPSSLLKDFFYGIFFLLFRLFVGFAHFNAEPLLYRALFRKIKCLFKKWKIIKRLEKGHESVYFFPKLFLGIFWF